ncbi:MAG TPA: prepilin-type N-terminal cleavage/methylation domain-containing protein, partial [Epsilonproteobacteria bacterium]|nr:prepilin-type N-terminal cleavage/methylation domain-containing protein [Campylobacterota bacterium]
EKSGFTILELIFVIIILGIISSIGSTIIVNIYESYVLQRATHRVNLKTELAVQQIANYLSYRIQGTTLARDPNALNDSINITDATSDTDRKHTVLEWLGSDNDSFSARRVPGWNGFCDIAGSNQNILKTPGSSLPTARNIIRNLSNNAVNLYNNGTPNVAIIFRDSLYTKNPDIPYDAKTCMGMVNANTSCISTVRRPPAGTPNRNQTLSFVTGALTQKVIIEHYKLAWTAYAIIPFKTDDSGPCAEGESPCNLKLYYNYQPWDGTRLSAANYNAISHATIATNVTVFKFAEFGSTFRIKLCAQENIGDSNISVCKEKAIVL